MRSNGRGLAGVRAKISGLHTTTKRLANGDVRIYAYASRGGELLTSATGRDLATARRSLEGAFDTKAMHAKLAELREADSAIERRQSDRHVFGLVTAYLASPEFARLQPSTKTAYRDYLERFRAEFGEDRVAMFEKAKAVEDLTDWRDELAEKRTGEGGRTAGGPRAADYAMQAVSALFRWARGRGKTTANPTADVSKLHSANRSDIIWTEADLLQLAKLGGGQSMVHDGTTRPASDELMWVVRLAAYTGLRQGDLLRLPRSAVSDLAITLRTSKRGRLVIVPLIPAARELIAAIPKRGPILLTSTLGKPWTSDGFRSSFGKACAAAKVQKRFHDLRGTAATRLKTETDLSHQDIADIMGWSKERVDAIMALYVSADVIALDMLRRMGQERAATNRLQTGAEKTVSEPKRP